jgi:hypothetical protein
VPRDWPHSNPPRRLSSSDFSLGNVCSDASKCVHVKKEGIMAKRLPEKRGTRLEEKTAVEKRILDAENAKLARREFRNIRPGSLRGDRDGQK